MCKKGERTGNQHDKKSLVYRGIEDLAHKTFIANNIYVPSKNFIH
jgi:hypothetical protein